MMLLLHGINLRLHQHADLVRLHLAINEGSQSPGQQSDRMVVVRECDILGKDAAGRRFSEVGF